MRIYKYKLEPETNQMIDMPTGAEIVDVAAQGCDVCLWAMVDPKVEKERRRFAVFGTGWEISKTKKMRYVGTAHNVEGAGLVFHVIEYW